MTLTAIILTFNEGKHLPRCLDSVAQVADRVVVADSYSTDNTVELAEARGAKVIQNEWVNHAVQFNWALAQLPDDTEWVMRIDADEYLTPQLIDEIRAGLPKLNDSVDGVYVNRRMTFLQQPIRHGGVFPIQVLRLFRYGRGRCENRWMDEHIIVSGGTVVFEGELIDDNLNSLTWWTDKHNRYASREAVDLLNLEYRFMEMESVGDQKGRSQAGTKRWIKENIYRHLPLGFRAFAYFFYRYFLRLGFLDGKIGAAFHFLQGFWYRYLVDIKVAEVEWYMQVKGVDVETAIRKVLAIDLGKNKDGKLM